MEQIRRQAQPGSREREWKKENHLTPLFSGGQRCCKLDIKTQIAFRRVTPCQEILHVWREETTIPISCWENNIFIFRLFIEWKLWGIHFYGPSGPDGGGGGGGVTPEEAVIIAVDCLCVPGFHFHRWEKGCRFQRVHVHLPSCLYLQATHNTACK